MWASRHPRREVKVGAPTAATMLAQKLAPGLLDRYLGRKGFDAQMTEAPDDPIRRDNLYESVPFDLGAHGPFDERSHARSAQWWTSKHRLALAGMATAVALALVSGAASRRR